MGVIKRPDSKNYYYLFTIRGKRYTGSCRTANKNAAIRYERKIHNEITELVMTQDGEPTSFIDACERYLDTKKPKNNESKKKGQTRYRNARSIVCRLMGYQSKRKAGTNQYEQYDVDGLFGHGYQQCRGRMLHEIDQTMAVRFVKSREADGVAPSSLKLVIFHLRGIIKHNKELGYAVNPKDIEFPKVGVANTRLRYITKDEERLLLNHLDTERTRDIHDMAIVMLDCGLRGGEVVALDWSQVDFDNNKLTIWRSKNNSQSVLTMTTRVANMFRTRWSSRENGVLTTGSRVAEMSTHIFSSPYTGEERTSFSYTFKQAVDKLGLNAEAIVKASGGKLTPHSLRRTFASRLVQQSVPIEFVSQMLGHSSVVITQKYYAHLKPDSGADQIADVLNRINGGVEP